MPNRIATSAPTRIDLAGGTIDIWPLYLSHDGASTVNAAISLRAHAEIEARTDGRVVLDSVDTGKQVGAAGWRWIARTANCRCCRSPLRQFGFANGATLSRGANRRSAP